jgi:hypothetical protein
LEYKLNEWAHPISKKPILLNLQNKCLKNVYLVSAHPSEWEPAENERKNRGLEKFDFQTPKK